MSIIVAVMMTVLVICAAMVIDLGNAKDVRRQSQNSADAAALAGTNVLYPTSNACQASTPVQAPPCTNDAVAAAKAYALANFNVDPTAWGSCTDASALAKIPPGMGSSTCISFDSLTATTQMQVKLPTRLVQTFFGGFTGKQTIAVGSFAQAQLGQTVNCSLCFLGAVDAGNADFSVTGGATAVNGNVTAGPNSNWTATVNGVAGSVSGGVFNPAATTIPSFGDPYSTSLVLPLDQSGLTSRTNPCTQGPGVYGTFDFPGNSTCTLATGVYVITGKWTAGNKTLVASANGGVTLYAKYPAGQLDFKNGDVAITALTSGASAGYAIIYDRNNVNSVGLQGNGGTSITGRVYAPASALDFNGNSCFGFSGGPIVVNGVVKANGNKSCVTVTNPAEATVVRTAQYLSK